MANQLPPDFSSTRGRFFFPIAFVELWHAPAMYTTNISAFFTWQLYRGSTGGLPLRYRIGQTRGVPATVLIEEERQPLAAIGYKFALIGAGAHQNSGAGNVLDSAFMALGPVTPGGDNPKTRLEDPSVPRSSRPYITPLLQQAAGGGGRIFIEEVNTNRNGFRMGDTLWVFQIRL